MELAELKAARKEGALEPFLMKFVSESAGKLSFDNVDYFCRQELISIIEEEYDKEKWDPFWASSYVNTLRLLSRDENNLETVFSSEKVRNFLLALAKLPADPKHPVETFVHLEAIKCLVNALYKSSQMRSSFGAKSHEAMRNILKSYAGKTNFSTEETLAYYLLLRIVFITTAIQPEFRKTWANESYLGVLLSILEQSLSLALIGNQQVFEDLQTRVNEILKVIFNLFCKEEPSHEENELILRLIRKVLISNFGENEDCLQHCTNVLSTVPVSLKEICPTSAECQSGTVIITFEDREMSVIRMLVQKMEDFLDTDSAEKNDYLCIYITALWRYCFACAQARRFVRLLVLPPLSRSDVERPPDEGNTFRNKLVRAMKSPSRLNAVASELVFVLCKKSVPRMIKYTGFGHSAGLLANSGLLGQINVPRSDENSEDSETEDYASVEEKVNPVTGCIRENLPDPMAGMSEEQKIFEAEKLLNHLNSMLDAGVIKPATIDPDTGATRPLKHVLELAKTLAAHNDDSDSD